MKNYLLLVYGDFRNTKTSNDVIETVSHVTSTQLLRFKETSTSILIHFGSEDTLNNLKGYFERNLKKRFETYIFTEMTNETTVVMPEIDIVEFMNLSESMNDTNKVQNTNFSERQTNEIEYILQTLLGGAIMDDESLYDEDDDDDDDYLIKKPSNIKKVKEYNVDEILDKIKINGRQSLTTEEENFLKTI
jgi:hypothetical protein